MDNVFNLRRQRERHAAEIAAFREKREKITDEQRYKKWLKMATEPVADPAQAAEYQRVRIESIQINVFERTPWAESFSMTVRLDPNESYVFREEYTEKIYVRKLSSIKGSSFTVQPTPHVDATKMDFYWNESDNLYVPIEHPEYGMWQLDVKNQMRAEWQIGLTRDQAVKTLLDSGLITSFTDGTHFVLSENIQSSLLPSGNDIDLSSYGSPTKEFFIDIFDHFERIGRMSYPFDGERIRVERIFVPVTVPKEIKKWVSVVAAITGNSPTDPGQTIDPDTQREIYRFGTPRQFYGENFELVALETLPENYVYVSTNKPATIMGLKPSQDKSFILRDREPQNETGFKARVTEGHMQPDPLVANYARFKYAS